MRKKKKTVRDEIASPRLPSKAGLGTKEVRQLLLEGDFHAAAESGATISLFVRCLTPDGHYKHEAALVFARCKRTPNVNEIRATLGSGSNGRENK